MNGEIAMNHRSFSSFPRKREPRASDERLPPVQARGRLWTPASAGATRKRFGPSKNCSKLNTTFVSLRNPNFRIYFAAQIGSNIGAWIQITAENWLVLQLTPTLPSPANGEG